MSVRGEEGGRGLDHLQWIHSRHSCSLLCLPNCLLSSLTINICPPTPLAAFPVRRRPASLGPAAAAAVLGRGNPAWAESCAQQKRIDLVWRCPERGTVSP